MDQIVTGKSYIDAARHYVATIKWQQILTHYVVIKKEAPERWRVRAIIADDHAKAAKSEGCKVFRICADGSVERI